MQANLEVLMTTLDMKMLEQNITFPGECTMKSANKTLHYLLFSGSFHMASTFRVLLRIYEMFALGTWFSSIDLSCLGQKHFDGNRVAMMWRVRR